MLSHLHISNFAIVPTLDLAFQPGFTAITGETGAGKSILVEALGLLLGERSDANWVRPGTARAELAAEFSVEDNHTAREWLETFELANGSQCLLRRTINSRGRSRAFINGSPVTVTQLQALGNLLVEIHGQNEHLQLTKTAPLFALLDGSGNYTKPLKAVKAAYKDWQTLARALAQLEQETPASATDLEFMKFQLDELQQHDLDAAAIAALQTEHDRLAAGGTLLEALSDSMERLDPENGSHGVNTGIHSVLEQLQAFTELDTDIQAACQMLQEAAVNGAEAVNALRAARERVELNPARYASVSATLGQLHDLARKHNVPMPALAQVRDQLAARIAATGSVADRRQALQAQSARALGVYRNAAMQLYEMRQRHAATLSQRVTELMAELGMADGHFDLLVNNDPNHLPGVRGDDRLQINVSTNPGVPSGPLAKIASGGELSRIGLAIKVAASSGQPSITQIFDEVDAGIGGETANTVGRLLRRLAGTGQALCVTHLAQVAVCASHQLQVCKASDATTPRVDTCLLDARQRVDEIARMLGGRLSAQSRAHAQELLLAAQSGGQ